MTKEHLDFRLGDEHEEMVRQLLHARSGGVGKWEVSKGYEPGYDLIWRYFGMEHRIECKEDFLCYRTHRFAVEVASHVKQVALNKDRELQDIIRGVRPSGLSQTKAHSIIYTLHIPGRKGAPTQPVEVHPAVTCMEVTWRMSPLGLWRAIEHWDKRYQVWRKETRRDPQHTAVCYVVTHAEDFTDTAPGLTILDESPCRHPWRHCEK